MLSIGSQNAAVIFEKMDNEEVRELSNAMSNLGNISAGVLEQLFIAFAEPLSGTGGLVGSHLAAEQLLMGALPEDRGKEIIESMQGPAGRTMWDKLGNVNEAVLANYLKNEYPQTVAVILSKLKVDQASRVLSVLPENFSIEVIMRMLGMEVVQKDIVDHVARTLRNEFMTSLATTARQDPHELMADIFNNLDRNAGDRFMTALEERNRDAAERIRALMFTFDDLAGVDPQGIQVLLRQVEKDQLALALKGASDDLKELFFANMSERAGKMMKEDMDAMGAVRLTDVAEAQAGVVGVAKALSDAGEIIIASGADDEMVG